jgi:hypothetical protein
MVTVKLLGGLGNQMFQYALGRHLSILNQTQLRLDLSSLLKRDDTIGYIYRDFELNVFNIRCDIKKSTNRFQTKFNQLFNPYNHISEGTIDDVALILNQKGNIYLDGFWQSEGYFEDIQAIIKKDFEFKSAPNPKNQVFLEQVASSNSVSVHFRRGDYVTNPLTNQFHGVCSTEYYLSAIQLTKEKVTHPHFFIFSDDLNWVKEHIMFDAPHTFINNNSGKDSFEDMRLMANCKHNIIANSSFSWWGGWLNKNNDKIIIAPQKWFNDEGMNKKAKRIIPDTWIRL